MASTSKVTRSEFTAASALAIVSGVTITISGCGGDADSPTMPTLPGSATGVVGSNHGHTATVTAAQLMSSDTVSLDITGGADHPHIVALSATELQQISAGTRVSTPSTINSGHAHTVTFN